MKDNYTTWEVFWVLAICVGGPILLAMGGLEWAYQQGQTSKQVCPSQYQLVQVGRQPIRNMCKHQSNGTYIDPLQQYVDGTITE